EIGALGFRPTKLGRLRATSSDIRLAGGNRCPALRLGHPPPDPAPNDALIAVVVARHCPAASPSSSASPAPAASPEQGTDAPARPARRVGRGPLVPRAGPHTKSRSLSLRPQPC